jgi:hypothetical protein
MTNRPDPDPELDRLLAAWTAPSLPAGFAERLEHRVAAAAARAAFPPMVAPRHRPRRWGSPMRLGGAAVGIALMAASATAGVFGNVGVTIPAWQRTVERATGLQLAERAPARRAATAAPSGASQPAAPATTALAPSLQEIVADGKIETREELDAAAAAMAERTEQRRALLRERRNQRLDAALEARRERGLPVPSDEQVERLRAEREARIDRREQAIDQRREAVRQELQRRIDSGEAIELPPPATGPETRAERRERLRQRRAQRMQERRVRPDGDQPQASGEAEPSPATDQ